MLTIGNFLNHFLIKSMEIIRLATGNKVPIHHDILIDPVRSGIFEVSLQRRP